MAKVLFALYDDPVTGYSKSYARDGLPKIDKYPDGQTLPTPEGIDFQPGSLLGSVSGELELRPIRNEYLIVQGGKLAGTGAHSYSAGNATGGSEEGPRRYHGAV
jgi:formate dehydrogenase